MPDAKVKGSAMPGERAKASGSSRARESWKIARKVLTGIKAHNGVSYQHRSFLYHMLNSKSKRTIAQTYKRFVMAVIMCDVVIYTLSTIPKLSADPTWMKVFGASEALTSVIFILEYFMRVCVVTEGVKYGQHGPIMGRIRYLLSIPAIIDAVATFPFFIEVGHNAKFPYVPGWTDTAATCVEGAWSIPRTTPLRILRIWKLLRTEKYARAVAMTHRILWFNREILTAAFLNCATLVFLTSALLFYMPPNPNTVKNSEFESLPSSMYLAVLMLTGQGLEVEGEVPWWTKIVIMATSLFSVAVFAIPASMITWGFEAEATRLAKKNVARRRAKAKGAEDGESDDHKALDALFRDSDTSASESGSDDFGFFADEECAWEEYEGAIVGSDDEGESEDGAKSQAAPPATKGARRGSGGAVGALRASADASMDKVLALLQAQAKRMDTLTSQVSKIESAQQRIEDALKTR